MPIEADVIKQTKKIAKKDIACDACNWLFLKMNLTLFNKISKKEQKAVQRMQRAKGIILKGSHYIEEEGVYNGKPYASNYVSSIHEINIKFGIYTPIQAN